MGEKEQKTSAEAATIKLASLPPEGILSEVIAPLEKQISKRRNKCLLTFYYPEEENVGMTPRDVSVARSILSCGACKKNVDIFIHSGGGDIHTAYKLAKLLQKRCENTTALIPEYAKSAATLLALGCKNIEMSSIAEIGPLDPIIYFEETMGLPAFAIRDAPKVLEREIEECQDPEVRKLKAEFVIGPIAAKIDPYVLSDVSHMPVLAFNYGKKLLDAVGYSPSSVERILKRLVLEKGRPSHGYVIDVDESIELELNAAEMDENTETDILPLLSLYRTYERKRHEEGNPMVSPIIRLTSPPVQESTS